MDGKCARCRKPLNGQPHTGLPAFEYGGYLEHNPDGDRYCSARCIEATVDERMHRPKRHVRTGPGFGQTEPEQWPRFAAEIPPEIATLLDAAQRKSLGVNYKAGSRAGMVRAGLLLYLHRVANVDEPPITATAEEIGEELPRGSSDS